MFRPANKTLAQITATFQKTLDDVNALISANTTRMAEIDTERAALASETAAANNVRDQLAKLTGAA